MNEQQALLDKIDWTKMQGLLPAIVQDAESLQVLTLAYMSLESLVKTLDTGLVTFYSRSRNTLWVKGETSGDYLFLVDISLDCDGDALLIQARPKNNCCHLGNKSCYSNSPSADYSFLKTLVNTVETRLSSNDENSYVKQLLSKPIERVAQKVGEEGVEVALAAVTGNQDNLLNESADLLFHLILLLKASQLDLGQVLSVLKQRAK